MTPPEAGALEVYEYHQHMLSAAKDALFNVQPEDRDITAITVPVSRKTYQD